MNMRIGHVAQDQLSPQQVEVAQTPEDRRWPGLFMVLLLLLAVVWPLAGIAAALIAYLTADREQATVLFAVAAGVLVLRWALTG
jgi:hypothetical protein